MCYSALPEGKNRLGARVSNVSEEPTLNNRIIVFSPHPDDFVLGCGGIIAKKVTEGFEVIIVMITDGRHAFLKGLGISSEPTPEEVKQIRKAEAIRASEILGVPEKNLRFFDFEDGTLEEHEKEAEEKIIEIIKAYSPADYYFPFRRDCHPDHRAANRIVHHALRQLGKEGSYEYNVTHIFARVGPRVEELLSLFKRDRIEVDVSKVIDVKKKAIETYKSETTIISHKQKRPLHTSVEKFLTGKEVFYLSRRS
jgi:LmbE family N-acetylglucosaminyl deacetylase